MLEHLLKGSDAKILLIDKNRTIPSLPEIISRLDKRIEFIQAIANNINLNKKFITK